MFKKPKGKISKVIKRLFLVTERFSVAMARGSRLVQQKGRRRGFEEGEMFGDRD